MNKHNLDHYVKHGFEYNSIINRLVITQTSKDKYDLTLKPKNIFMSMLPSFYHVEIETKDGVPITSIGHYHIIIYSIFIGMLIGIYFIGINVDKDYPIRFFVLLGVILLFKIYGNYQLKAINSKLLSGEEL